MILETQVNSKTMPLLILTGAQCACQVFAHVAWSLKTVSVGTFFHSLRPAQLLGPIFMADLGIYMRSAEQRQPNAPQRANFVTVKAGWVG